MANDLLSKITADTRPSDFIYALMSQQVYDNDKLKKGSKLPGYDDWKVLRIKRGESDYFGVIYINTDTKQLVVAHKGTYSIGAVIEDIRGIILSGESPHKKEAFALTQEAIDHIGIYEDYHLSFTGHSLGGFLAELCVFYCPRSFDYHGHVNAVTFESPGVLQSLQRLESNLERINTDGLDIIGYVSYPNFINTFNNHIGTLYTFEADLGQWADWSGWYTYKAHTIDTIVECLRNESNYKLSYLTDWPMGSQRDIFFDEAKFKDGKYRLERHDDFVEANKQHFKLDFNGHHHIDAELSNRTCLPLKHFPPSLHAFLKAFHICLFNSGGDREFRARLLEQWKLADIPDYITEYLLGGYHIEKRQSGLEVLRLDLSQNPGLATVTIAKFREDVSIWLNQSGNSIAKLLSLFSSSLPQPALTIITAVVATGATLAEGAIVTDNTISVLEAYLPANPSEHDVAAAKAMLSELKAGVSSITTHIIAPGVHVPKGAKVSGNKASVGNIHIGQSQAQLANAQRRHENSFVFEGTIKENEPLSAAASAAAPAPGSVEAKKTDAGMRGDSSCTIKPISSEGGVHVTVIGASHSGSGAVNVLSSSIHVPIVVPQPKQPISDWQVPANNANYFIQRDEFYKPLAAYFSKDGTKQSIIVVNAGLGGVGKTELAVYYSHHAAKAYPLKCWFKASTKEGLIAEYRAFCNNQHIMPSESDSTAIIQAVRNWFSHSNRQPWLIVYDDAENQHMLQEFLPNKGGDILITTRHQDWSYSKLSVTIMNETEAIALLNKTIAPNPESKLIFTEQDEVNLKVLAEKLGKLPLALAQAGAYIHAANGCVSITEYLELFEEFKLALLEDDRLPSGQNHEPVAVTWSITLTALQKKCPNAIKLLEAMSFLDSNSIPYYLVEMFSKQVEPSWNKLELVKAIRNVSDYSMVQQSKNSNETTFSMHNLVQLVIRSGLTDDYRQACLMQWMTCINHLKNSVDATEDPLLIEQVESQLLSHNIRLLDYIKKENFFDVKLEKAHFYHHIAVIYFKLGHPQKQKDLLEEALSIQTAHYGRDHWQTAGTLGNLANAYSALGDNPKQKDLLEEALVIETAHYGRAHWQTALTLNNLANAHGDLGDTQKKKDLLEEVLGIFVAHYGRGHWRTALTLNNLANAYGALGDTQKQKDLLEEVLGIFIAHYGRGHWQTAITLGNLANVYGNLGDTQKQKDLLEEALRIQVAHYGRAHWQTAMALNNLALAYGDLGDNQKKKELLEEALRIKVAHYGQWHWETAMTLGNLAIAYGDLGDNQKKKDLLVEALVIQTDYYGRAHWQTARTLNNLANVYGELGDTQKKKDLLEDVLSIQTAHYGRWHWQTASTLVNLANAHGDLVGDTQKKKDLLEEALGIFVAHYGRGHYEVGKTAFNLAIVYLGFGELKLAYETMEYAYNCLLSHPLHSAYPHAQKAKLFLAQIKPLIANQIESHSSSASKPNHPRLCTPSSAARMSMSPVELQLLLRQIAQKNMDALNYYRANDYAQALALWRHAFEIAQRITKEEYPNYHDELATLNANIGTTHKQVGHYDDARKFLKQSIALREEKYGINCPEAQKSRDKLDEVERLSAEWNQEKIPALSVSIQSDQSLGKDDCHSLVNALPRFFTSPDEPLLIRPIEGLKNEHYLKLYQERTYYSQNTLVIDLFGAHLLQGHGRLKYYSKEHYFLLRRSEIDNQSIERVIGNFYLSIEQNQMKFISEVVSSFSGFIHEIVKSNTINNQANVSRIKFYIQERLNEFFGTEVDNLESLVSLYDFHQDKQLTFFHSLTKQVTHLARKALNNQEKIIHDIRAFGSASAINPALQKFVEDEYYFLLKHSLLGISMRKAIESEHIIIVIESDANKFQLMINKKTLGNETFHKGQVDTVNNRIMLYCDLSLNQYPWVSIIGGIGLDASLIDKDSLSFNKLRQPFRTILVEELFDLLIPSIINKLDKPKYSLEAIEADLIETSKNLSPIIDIVRNHKIAKMTPMQRALWEKMIDVAKYIQRTTEFSTIKFYSPLSAKPKMGTKVIISHAVPRIELEMVVKTYIKWKTDKGDIDVALLEAPAISHDLTEREIVSLFDTILFLIAEEVKQVRLAYLQSDVLLELVDKLQSVYLYFPKYFETFMPGLHEVYRQLFDKINTIQPYKRCNEEGLCGDNLLPSGIISDNRLLMTSVNPAFYRPSLPIDVLTSNLTLSKGMNQSLTQIVSTNHDARDDDSSQLTPFSMKLKNQQRDQSFFLKDTSLINVQTSSQPNTVLFNFGKFDPLVERDRLTHEPIFTYRVYFDNNEVGYAKFYGQPLLCKSPQGNSHNLIELSGVLSGFTLTNEMELTEICRVLPPSLFKRALFASSRGVINGTFGGCSKLLGLVLNDSDYSPTTQFLLSQSFYYTGTYVLQFAEYYYHLQIEEESTRIFQSLLQAAYNTQSLLFINLALVIINLGLLMLSDWLQKKHGEKASHVVKCAGDLVKYGYFAYTQRQQGILENTLALSTSAITELVIEKVGSTAIAQYNYGKKP